MKKKKPIIVSVIAAGFLLLLTLYAAVCVYYRNGFSFGTFVNGVYCTGKSVEEINTELAERYEKTSFFLLDASGREYEISLSEVSFLIDYKSQLEELKNKQSTLAWVKDALNREKSILHPKISFDEALLKEALVSCGIMQVNEKKHTVEIHKEDGYVLYDGMQDVLDMEKVYTLTAKALYEECFQVDVSSCYVNLPYTEEMKETLALWKKVSAFQTCGIIYDMGDKQIPLSPKIVCEFLALEEDGSFALDETGNLIFREEAVGEFVDMLCEQYDTFGSKRIFQATRGEAVEIEGGTYGTLIDRKAEIAYLKEAFMKNVQEIHIPAYEKEGYVRGQNDIGGTYVEIDMTKQKLYYYEEGVLLLETDIVTGNLRRHWGTPSGVNYVYGMQTNRILRGTGYASHVDFWVPVKGNIGIHDASWRKEFGGEIYKTSGSHGCINVPKERMEELYEMLEIGVPVVMFY